MSRCAPSLQWPPFCSVNRLRTSSQTDSESTSSPSRSKMTAAISVTGLRLAEGDAELAALDGRLLAGAIGPVAHRGGEGFTRDVGLVLTGRVQQLVVAAQLERDPVGNVEAGLLAGLLDCPD